MRGRERWIRLGVLRAGGILLIVVIYRERERGDEWKPKGKKVLVVVVVEVVCRTQTPSCASGVVKASCSHTRCV